MQKQQAKAKGVQLYHHISDIVAELTEVRTAMSRDSAFPTALPVITFPVPLMNIINGGKHAGSDLAIQEFMIAPIGV